jgi:DNA-directed RNA polymerase alpha subunit
MKIDTSIVCQFKFICTQKWDSLQSIDGQKKIRFCGVCNSAVYQAHNYQELAVHIEKKRCVSLIVEHADSSATELTGLVVPALPWTDSLVPASMALPISHLEFTDLVEFQIQERRLQLVGDLVICTEEQLREEFQFANETILEIKEVLESRGHFLGMKLDNWHMNSEKYRSR